ncbi:hypothetical protein GE061_001415 [Apolygus lucorum]|uniref:Uncharacterized protein n=1 Tax=Apolygus lucorum TaxID=248454 RepID=A0A8S9Y708_APOLU|nr:hypothetical protein GE061_001415 [Apolygus lucorum]
MSPRCIDRKEEPPECCAGSSSSLRSERDAVIDVPSLPSAMNKGYAGECLREASGFLICPLVRADLRENSLGQRNELLSLLEVDVPPATSAVLRRESKAASLLVQRQRCLREITYIYIYR